MNRGESKTLVGQLFNIIRDFSTISSYSTFTISDLALYLKKSEWIKIVFIGSFPLTSITLLPSHLIYTYIFLRPLMHNPNSVYYLNKVLCRFPLLHAQFPSTESLSIWKHCSHLQNLSSLGYILSLTSHFSVLLSRHPLKEFSMLPQNSFPPFSLGFIPVKCIILSLYWICLTRSQMTTMLLNLTVNSQS